MNDPLLNNRVFRALNRIPVVGAQGSAPVQMAKALVFCFMITVVACAAMYGGYKTALLGVALAFLIAVPMAFAGLIQHMKKQKSGAAA